MYNCQVFPSKKGKKKEEKSYLANIESNVYSAQQAHSCESACQSGSLHTDICNL
jgi:hypothetical protein